MLTVIALIILRSNVVVPALIKNQVSSTILVPIDDVIKVDKDSYKYNDSQKLLSFTARYENNVLTITEQPTPESFTDIPQAFDSLVSQMGEYSKFDTAIGTVHLTSPQNQQNIQIAVLNTKGTLTFVKSESKLEKDEWNDFLNAFEVVK